jgi:hypothetical protein
MAMQKKSARLPVQPKKSPRGRTANVNPGGDAGTRTKGAVRIEKRTEVTRPTSSGGGRNRGDRRDMSPTYTNNAKHAARGNTPRRDVKTRKR